MYILLTDFVANVFTRKEYWYYGKTFSTIYEQTLKSLENIIFYAFILLSFTLYSYDCLDPRSTRTAQLRLVESENSIVNRLKTYFTDVDPVVKLMLVFTT